MFTVLANKNTAEHEKSRVTQFGRVCKDLNIAIITTSVPQKKPCVERGNRTMQDRLTAELSIRNIKTIDEANAVLPEIFDKINDDLGKTKYIEGCRNSFGSCSELKIKDLSLIFTTKTLRTVDSGNAIRNKNKFYLEIDSETKGYINMRPQDKALLMYSVIKDKFFISVNFRIFEAEQITMEQLNLEDKKHPSGKAYASYATTDLSRP